MTGTGHSFDGEEARALLGDERLSALVDELAAADDPLTAAELADRRGDQDRRDVEDRLARLLAAGVVEPASATAYRLSSEAVDLLSVDDEDEAASDVPDEVPGTEEGDEPGPTQIHRVLVDALANRSHRPAMDSFIRKHGMQRFAAVVYHAYRVERGEVSESEAADELDVDVDIVSETREIVADHVDES
jgi:hypothetical protein